MLLPTSATIDLCSWIHELLCYSKGIHFHSKPERLNHCLVQLIQMLPSYHEMLPKYQMWMWIQIHSPQCVNSFLPTATLHDSPILTLYPNHKVLYVFYHYYQKVTVVCFMECTFERFCLLCIVF